MSKLLHKTKLVVDHCRYKPVPDFRNITWYYSIPVLLHSPYSRIFHILERQLGNPLLMADRECNCWFFIFLVINSMELYSILAAGLEFFFGGSKLSPPNSRLGSKSILMVAKLYVHFYGAFVLGCVDVRITNCRQLISWT